MPQMVIPWRRWVTRGALRGQAVIEMAIIMPILLVLVGSAVDFGLFMFQREQAGACVREVARKATVRNLDAMITDPNSALLVQQCKLAARMRAGTAGAPALATAFEPPTGIGPAAPLAGTAISASIDYPYNPIFLDLAFPIGGWSPLTNMRVKVKVTMRMEAGAA
jgi:Flp pilus assembly protein TadG